MIVLSAVVVGGLVVVDAAGPVAPSAEAVPGADFKPGNIVSDAVFYDSSTMSASQIQAFLDSKVPVCRDGYTCLKDYTQAYPSQPARAEGCSAISGLERASAAWMIWVVSTACGINPQSLIVLLQKEQGLITDSWPTARQYRSATGYGCPDTADCDATYYGFFNQLYNAAWQFKKYQARPDGRAYQAGRFNTILWHPNSGCGSSQVYIENQATAGLYLYTPYRPNQAALDNMYGVGDSCSSYGNRNFFRDFADWFGDPTGGSHFARTSSDPTIYLLSGSVKYPVPSMEVYGALSALGTYRIVTQSYLDGYSTSSKWATEAVRDPATGAIYLAQGTGKHQFPSCELLTRYGFSCAAAIDLTASQLRRWSTGGPVTPFFVVPGSSLVYQLVAGGRYHVYEWSTVVELNGGTAPFVASMRPDVAAQYPVLKTILRPRSLAKSPSSDAVYFIDGFDTKIPITSFGIAGEYGARGYLTVPQSVLDGYTTASSYLSIVGVCSGTPVVASAGTLRSWPGADKAGLGAFPLSIDTCTRVPQGAPGGGELFIKTPADATVYHVKDGRRRAMTSWEELLRYSGGTSPSIAVVSAATVAAIPAAPLLEPTSVVRSPTDPMVYFIDGTAQKIPVASFVTVGELGRGTWSTVAASSLAAYPAANGYLTRVLSCAGQAYFAAGGTLHPLTSPTVTGITPTTVTADTCGRLKLSTAAALGTVFVKAPESATVYLVVDGTRRPVPSWTRLLELAGGTAPVILLSSTGGLADIPIGPTA